MAKEESTFEAEGIVIETLPNAMFRVKLFTQEEPILAHISGRMRINHIKILPGDKVTIAFSPYDLTRGRITFRHKDNKPSIENNTQS